MTDGSALAKYLADDLVQFLVPLSDITLVFQMTVPHLNIFCLLATQGICTSNGTTRYQRMHM
jgi:hypothetical protein